MVRKSEVSGQVEKQAQKQEEVLIKTNSKELVAKLNTFGFEVVHMHGGVRGGFRKIYYLKGDSERLNELMAEEKEVLLETKYAEINEHIKQRIEIKEQERKESAVTKVHAKELVPSATY